MPDFVVCLFVCFWRDTPQWASSSSFTRFLDHTQRHTTVGRTSLDKYLFVLAETTHNTHNRRTSMPSVGFDPTISASERSQTYAITAWPLGPAQIFLITFIEFFALSHCTSLRAAWSLTEPLHTPLSQTEPLIFRVTIYLPLGVRVKGT